MQEYYTQNTIQPESQPVQPSLQIGEKSKSCFFPVLALIVALILALGVSAYFGFCYFLVNSQFEEVSSRSEQNAKIAEFERFFVSKILRATGEVSYQDRLKLESSITAINDQEITDSWQKFLDSQTESEAQQNVFDLLELISSKIR